MSALSSLSKLASDSNIYLAGRIDDFEKARRELERVMEDQGVAIRALASVRGDHDAVRRGHELEARAAKALGNVEVGR